MTIGVMGALEEEVQIITDRMVVSGAEEHVGRTFYRGNLAGHKVVVVHSGIGKVRAAARSQFLIEHFAVDRLVFIGVAGALNPELTVGDIVVSDYALQWDFRSVSTDPPGYQADPALVDLAVKAAERLGYKVRVGSVLTGDRPVVKFERKQELWRTFNGQCVEMEGAAVAQVCFMNEVPFVLIRAISDLAEEGALQDFLQSFARVALLPGEMVLEMLKELG
ncbi:5'-methylthioadenosine/adenosylhomocysteine nucleosidase [Chloroflexota bacterium]